MVLTPGGDELRRRGATGDCPKQGAEKELLLNLSTLRDSLIKIYVSLFGMVLAGEKVRLPKYSAPLHCVAITSLDYWCADKQDSLKVS